jgi:hypothetical protein
MSMKYLAATLIVLFLLLLVLPRWALAQTVINCPSGFTGSTGGACSTGSAGQAIYCAPSSPTIVLMNGGVHDAGNALYQTPVNIQAFTTTFTFQDSCAVNPTNCGNGFGFMIIGANSSNPYYPPGFNYGGYSGNQFSWSTGCHPQNGGNSGCEAIDEALVKFDLYGTTAPGQDLTNYYQASTSIGGVYPEGASDLNMAPSGINLQSNHVFSVTLTYDGSNLFESITDTSTSANYTHTYTGINLPSIMGANTAFVGFSAGSGAATMSVNINGWTYTVNTP